MSDMACVDDMLTILYITYSLHLSTPMSDMASALASSVWGTWMFISSPAIVRKQMSDNGMGRVMLG